MKKINKSPHIIQSLDKGLYLLEVVEQANRPITLGELWSKLRWDKATIHRLLATLERRGYVLRDRETKQYSLGLKIYGLYNSLKRNLDIQGITKPFLLQLAEMTGESAHLAVVVEKYLDLIAPARGDVAIYFGLTPRDFEHPEQMFYHLPGLHGTPTRFGVFFKNG